jgi:hypothetical protein
LLLGSTFLAFTFGSDVVASASCADIGAVIFVIVDLLMSFCWVVVDLLFRFGRDIGSDGDDMDFEIAVLSLNDALFPALKNLICRRCRNDSFPLVIQ